MVVWSTACPDWKRRIKDKRSLIPFSPLFPASAEAKMAVFTSLRIVDMPGRPTIGETADQWLLDFAAALFGAYNPETGQQMIREGMLLVSKKNTKSTIAAGIMLTELICGWRESDENLILAPTKEIAENSFNPASDMIRADEELSALLQVQGHYRIITHRATKATLKVVAADAETVGGKKASRVLVDELWMFGKRAKADAMLREATGGQVSRPEGYTLYLTTQSDAAPAGIFKTKLDYFRSVRDGKVHDPSSLPVLYEFPEEMIENGAFLKPENFYLTNPNLGRSVSQSWLENEFRKIEDADDGSRQIFFAKHLNVEIGLRLSNDAWAGARYWESAVDPELVSLEELLDRCEVVVVGIDGGGLDDLLGLAVLGRCKVTRDWLLWTRAWAHEDVLKRRKEIAPTLLDFARDGDLILCAHPTQDVIEVADIVEQVKDSGLLPDIAGVGVDAAGITAIVDELAARGIGDQQVVAVQQGYRLNGAIAGSERKLKDGTLWHGGQKMMAWCAGNAKVEMRGSAMLITKQAAGRAKIDPLAAMFNAVMLMARNPEAQGNISDWIASLRT